MSAVGGEVLGDDDDHGQLVVDGEVAVEDIEQPPAEGLGVGEVAEVDGEARYADHRQHHRHQAQQDLHTPSLSDQPRAQETEDTEAGILATAPALIENSVLSMLTKTV